MDPDTALGVTAELNHFLTEGWTPIRDSNRIRVLPPQNAVAASNFNHLLQDEVWRIARLIAYSDFVSIERTSDGSYRVVSKITSGGSFEVLFQISRN